MFSEKLNGATNELLKEAEITSKDFSLRARQGSFPPYEEFLSFAEFLRHPNLQEFPEEIKKFREDIRPIQHRYFPTDEKRIYVGQLSERQHSRVMVKHVFDHLFLMRTYKTTDKRTPFRLSWRLNKEGKLDLIDVFYSNTREIKPLVHRFNNDFSSFDWNRAKFYVNNIPLDVEQSINTTFHTFKKKNQYEALVNYGHGLAQNILQVLYTHTSSNKKINDGQRTLKEIVGDWNICTILEKSASIRARLTYTENSENAFQISYTY